MATTTNYGWTTPDDTALVKDGASAIRTLGSSVDTTTKNLNPSTTLGDLEFRSSTSNVNTRIPIGSSGQHLTVVAGVPAWATASDQTPLTTKGDLFTFSTLDARLGVGANATVLTADSAEATGLKWATPTASGKSYALLSTTTLSSGTSTTVSSLSGYDNLYVMFKNIRVTDTGNNATKLQINSVTTGSNFYGVSVEPSTTFTTTRSVVVANAPFKLMNNGTFGAQDLNGYFYIEGANTAGIKMITQATFTSPNGGSNTLGFIGTAHSDDSAVVSSLTISTTGTAFNQGTMYIYGAV